jgi:hypothetical protein
MWVLMFVLATSIMHKLNNTSSSAQSLRVPRHHYMSRCCICSINSDIGFGIEQHFHPSSLDDASARTHAPCTPPLCQWTINTAVSTITSTTTSTTTQHDHQLQLQLHFHTLHHTCLQLLCHTTATTTRVRGRFVRQEVQMARFVLLIW